MARAVSAGLMCGSSLNGIVVPVRRKYTQRWFRLSSNSATITATMATSMRADALRNRQRILDAAARRSPSTARRRRWTTSRGGRGWASVTLYRHFATKETLVGELHPPEAVRVRRARPRVGSRRRATRGWRSRAACASRPTSWPVTRLTRTCRSPPRRPHAPRRAPAIAELRAAWGVVIARAKEAGVLREDFEADDIRTMMCGLGSMMAADAPGAMSYDWHRQLDLFLDGVRTTRSYTPRRHATAPSDPPGPARPADRRMRGMTTPAARSTPRSPTCRRTLRSRSRSTPTSTATSTRRSRP